MGVKPGNTGPPSAGFRPPAGEEWDWVLTKELGVAPRKKENIQLGTLPTPKAIK